MTATKTDSSNYVFEDVFVNADGNVIVEKKPGRGTDQTVNEGKTLFTYSEIDPDGNNGWNIDLPAYWGKRDNLVEILEIPKTPVYEAGSYAGEPNYFTSGKRTNFSYEPLFNQLRRVIHSKQKVDGTRIDLYSVTNEFDYQEFSPFEAGPFDPDNDANPMTTALFDQVRMGRYWNITESALNPGRAAIDNIDGAIQRQFTFQGRDGRQRMPFYGEDLNGDGIEGFPTDENNILSRAKAVPVRVIVEDLTGQSTDRRIYITWAQNGQPAGILEPNGKLTSYYYYPTPNENSDFDDVFGPTTMPHSGQFSQGNRGLLAHVSWNQYDDNYPQEMAGDVAPCQFLKGPYQWMLPNCNSNDIHGQLSALNIPNDVAYQLESTQNQKPKTISFSYNKIGQPYRIWENGLLSTVDYDTDGRVMRQTDTKQNVAVFTYDNDGNGTSIKAVDPNTGADTFDTRQRSDNEGNLLAECTALIAGGCDNFPGNIPALGQASPSGAQILVNQYTNEGLLALQQDPEGTLTYYTYDTRKRLVNVRTADPQDPTGGRETSSFYDDRSRLIANIYGTAGTQLSETYTYDDYDRQVSWTDTRGTDWQAAFGKKNELVFHYQSSTPFGISGAGSTTYSVQYGYNGHGEVVSKDSNGIINTEWSRFPDGRVWSIQSTGQGTTYMSYDTSGNVVWQQSPHYDVSLSVDTFDGGGPPVASTVQILREFDGETYDQIGVPSSSNDFLTLTNRTEFNYGFEPVLEIITGNDGISRTQSWTYNALGDVTQFTNPEGVVTDYLNNLAGWTTREIRETSNGNPQVSDVNYNARGQQVLLNDPSNQQTEWVYDGFGDLFQEFRPGSQGSRKTLLKNFKTNGITPKKGFWGNFK